MNNNTGYVIKSTGSQEITETVSMINDDSMVSIVNNSQYTVYLGISDVTADTGYPLSEGQSVLLQGPVYAITESGQSSEIRYAIVETL